MSPSSTPTSSLINSETACEMVGPTKQLTPTPPPLLQQRYVQSLEEWREERKQQRVMMAIVALTAVASVLTATLAMWWEASYVVYCAFVIPLVMAPYAILQRRQLNKLPRLKQQLNYFRAAINRLASQNVRFHNENNRLVIQQQKLQHVEEKLTAMATQAGTNVTELKNLVRENGTIQREMKKLQQADELQRLLTAILNSDRNKDFQLSEKELDQLCLRLKAFTYRPVDVQYLKLALAKGVSTTTLFHQLAAEFKEAEGEDQTDTWVDKSFGYTQGLID